MLLEAHRNTLIHLKELLETVGDARVLGVEHFTRGEVVDAVVEAQLGYLVVLLDELLDLRFTKKKKFNNLTCPF
jgi:hypothetical protein